MLLAFLQASQILVDRQAYANRLLLNTGPWDTLKMEAENCPEIYDSLPIDTALYPSGLEYHCHCDELLRHTVLRSSTEIMERSTLVEEEDDDGATSVSVYFQTTLVHVQ